MFCINVNAIRNYIKKHKATLIFVDITYGEINCWNMYDWLSLYGSNIYSLCQAKPEKYTNRQ